MSKTDKRHTTWYFPGNTQNLATYLPSVPSPNAPSLLVGQFWQLAMPIGDHQCQTNDVLRVEGKLDESILVTRFSKIRGTTYYRLNLGQTVIPISCIFTRPLSIRCHILRQSDGRYIRTPQWKAFELTPTPTWIAQTLTLLSSMDPDYVARPYTDGSFSTTPTIEHYF